MLNSIKRVGFVSLIALVIAAFIPLSDVSAASNFHLKKTSGYVYVDDSYTVKLLNSSENVVKGKTIKWTSSNKAVATVSSTGVVTGHKEGKSIISAKYKGKTYKFTAKVRIAWTEDDIKAIITETTGNKDEEIKAIVDEILATKNYNTMTKVEIEKLIRDLTKHLTGSSSTTIVYQDNHAQKAADIKLLPSKEVIYKDIMYYVTNLATDSQTKETITEATISDFKVDSIDFKSYDEFLADTSKGDIFASNGKSLYNKYSINVSVKGKVDSLYKEATMVVSLGCNYSSELYNIYGDVNEDGSFTATGSLKINYIPDEIILSRISAWNPVLE